MFSQRASVPMIEQLEGRRLFSAGIESVHGFIAPDHSPYLYGKYTMTLNAAASDPKQFSETHTVTIKRHDGPAFAGWIWGGKRRQLKGSWDAKDDMWRFSMELTSSTGRMVNRGTMVAWWNPVKQDFEGFWAYRHNGVKYNYDAQPAMTLTKVPLT